MKLNKSQEEIDSDKKWDRRILWVVSFLAGTQIYDIIKWLIN